MIVCLDENASNHENLLSSNGNILRISKLLEVWQELPVIGKHQNHSKPCENIFTCHALKRQYDSLEVYKIDSGPKMFFFKKRKVMKNIPSVNYSFLVTTMNHPRFFELRTEVN